MIITGASNEAHTIGRFEFLIEDTGGGCEAFVYRDEDTEACMVLSNAGLDQDLSPEDDVILNLYRYEDEPGSFETLYEGKLSGLTEEVIDKAIKSRI